MNTVHASSTNHRIKKLWNKFFAKKPGETSKWRLRCNVNRVTVTTLLYALNPVHRWKRPDENKIVRQPCSRGLSYNRLSWRQPGHRLCRFHRSRGGQRSTNEEKRDRRDRGRSSARDQRTEFAARNVKDEERQKIWQRNECRLVRERETEKGSVVMGVAVERSKHCKSIPWRLPALRTRPVFQHANTLELSSIAAG